MKPREGTALLLWHARWWLLGLLLPACLLMASGAVRLKIDNSVYVWFVEGDPALVAYDAFQDQFGNDEVVILSVQSDDGVLAGDGLQRLHAVHQAAKQTAGVADVTSLVDIAHIRIQDGGIEVEQAIDDTTTAAELRDRVLSDRTLRGKLISDDGNTALVLARLEVGIDDRRDAIMAELHENVEAIAPATPEAGIGLIFSALNTGSARDIAVVGTVSYGVIFGLLWLLFRRIGPVILTIGVVAISASATVGLMGWLGRDLNMVTMTLPTLVLIIGIADCVHMLRHVAARPEVNRKDRVVRGVGEVLWPCLFTSLTTAAGFAALGTAKMAVVRDLGWFSAAGVLLAFVTSLIVVLVALEWEWFEPKRQGAAMLKRNLVGVGDFSVRYRQEVLGLCVTAVLAGAWGISRIDVDTYSIDYFYESHEVRRDSAAIEATFGPYTPLELVLEGDDLRNVETLRAVAAWQDAMEQDDQVGWTVSVADVTRRLNQVWMDGTEADYNVPPNDNALEQVLFLYEQNDQADLTQMVVEGDMRADEVPAWTRLRVTAGIDMMSARDMGTAIDRLTALSALPEGVRIVPSGYLPLYVTMMDYVVSSQITSFAVAFVAIFTLLTLLFGSFRMALFAMPGNLLPIFVTLGVMGISGIRLDVATVTIAALILGLVVDDTTHFLYRYREMLHETGDHEAAVSRTLRSTGVAMTTTTVVLVLGFSILALATVKSVAYFGLLAALGLGTALVGDLMVLPALLVTMRPKL